MGNAFGSDEYTSTWSAASDVCAKREVAHGRQRSVSVPAFCSLPGDAPRMVSASGVASEGCFVHVKTPPAVGSCVTLRFELGEGRSTAELPSRVIASVTDGPESRRGCQVSFDSVEDDDLRILDWVARALDKLDEGAEDSLPPAEHPPTMLGPEDLEALLVDVTPPQGFQPVVENSDAPTSQHRVVAPRK